jgi:hypothetical protein
MKIIDLQVLGEQLAPSVKTTIAMEIANAAKVMTKWSTVRTKCMEV